MHLLNVTKVLRFASDSIDSTAYGSIESVHSKTIRAELIRETKTVFIHKTIALYTKVVLFGS